MDYFYNRCLHVYDGFADAPGYRTVKTIKAGILGQVGDQAALRRGGLKWKDFIDQGYVIAGSPKTVRERLREAMKSLNCGHLMMLMQTRLDAAGAGAARAPSCSRREVHAVSARPVERARGQVVAQTDAAAERAVPAPVHFDSRLPKACQGHARGQRRHAEARSAK